jgi:hypothetical protein
VIFAGGLLTYSFVDLFRASRKTEIADAQPSSQCQNERSDRLVTAKHLARLNEVGFCTIPDVLDPAILMEARKLSHLKFKAAKDAASDQVQGHGNAGDGTVRNDFVMWVREPDTSGALAGCVQLLRGIPHVLDEDNLRVKESRSREWGRPPNAEPAPTPDALLCAPEQLQLAEFSGGGRYVAHRDCSFETIADSGLKTWLGNSDYRRRRVTAILYLNDPDWDTGARGGALRLYNECDQDDYTGDSATDVVDVNPKGGTLLLFDR